MRKGFEHLNDATFVAQERRVPWVKHLKIALTNHERGRYELFVGPDGWLRGKKEDSAKEMPGYMEK